MARIFRRRRNRRLSLLLAVLAALAIFAIWLMYSLSRPPKVYLWIWKLSDAKSKYGGLEGIVRKVRENDCDGLIVCTNRGPIWLNDRQEVRDLWTLCRSNRLDRFAYGRFLRKDSIAESLRAVEAIEDRPDGFIFDLEGEYKGKAGKAEAEKLLGNVAGWNRNIASPCGLKVKLGFTSYGLPSRHPTFPWRVATKLCTWSNPQWYASTWKRTQGWSIAKSQKLITEEIRDDKLPFAPVLEAYGKNSGFGYTEPEDLASMLRFAAKTKPLYISVFRMELMDESHWKTIRKFKKSWRL